MAFHVFVEGATDSSSAGVSRLAEAIARHYGLPAADLMARLARGRFRVKGNTDRETADQYARDLERLGAICTIEEATAENSQRATPLPFPAVRPATPPAGLPAGMAALPPRASTTTPPAGMAALPPRASTTTPPVGSSALAGLEPSRTATPPAGTAALGPSTRPSTPLPVAGYQSGLSAAFSGEVPVASLGALESDNPAFTLGSVDGKDTGSHAALGNFEPPQGGLPASIGPVPEKPGATSKDAAAKAKAAKPKDEPLDIFAPPDQQGEEFQVHIAADEVEKTARKRVSTPPANAIVSDASATAGGGSGAGASAASTTGRISQPALRKSQPSMQVPNVAGGVAVEGGVAARSSSKLGPLGDERVRYVAGVVLAILLGFVPAHVVAGMREESAYAEIDHKVIRAQQAADTPETYALLDRMRADAIERKEAERRNAAIIAIVIWGLAAAGIGYVWFRKIPWDSFE